MFTLKRTVIRTAEISWYIISRGFLLMVVLGILYMNAEDYYFYLTRNEARERAAAEQAFLNAGHDPHLYRGPEVLTNEKKDHYTFVWKRIEEKGSTTSALQDGHRYTKPEPEDEIVINVKYFPYDIIY